MSAEPASLDPLKAVTLLGAAVVAVPLFRRLGLDSVLGYLAAGPESARGTRSGVVGLTRQPQ